MCPFHLLVQAIQFLLVVHRNLSLPGHLCTDPEVGEVLLDLAHLKYQEKPLNKKCAIFIAQNVGQQKKSITIIIARQLTTLSLGTRYTVPTRKSRVASHSFKTWKKNLRKDQVFQPDQGIPATHPVHQSHRHQADPKQDILMLPASSLNLSM